MIRLSLIFLSVLAAAFATETDQFTTPRTPLHDIGPELSRKIVRIIESDRSGEGPETVLSGWVGRNFIASRITRWAKGIRAADRQVGFRPNAFRSIYRLAFSPVPASFLFDSPTVRLHGYYFGTDKIDHFFQQGHKYFTVANAAGSFAPAVAYGVKQEHGYYGTLASGIYSNADLAANYAGMKFYLNMRHPVRVGDRVLPPMFERTSAGWRLRPGIDPDRLLEPFLSNHLDESLNPSRYKFSRRLIRTHIRTRCVPWTRFYADRLDLVAPAGQNFASTWFGEDYGHWLPPADEISIATVCDAGLIESVKRGPGETF
jgi:hypothetical protein